MRKIKFRVWDRKLHVMWEGIELKKLLSYLTFQSCPNADAYEAMKDHFDDMDWLQFTGLKDKNGKEIYEGDVVTEPGFATFPITVDEYHGYRFMWGKDILVKSQSKYGEVIGNIYENQDLLK